MRGLTKVLAGLLSIAALVLPAVPAYAHAYLISTSPAEGAVLTEAPERITLRFNEPVEVPTDGVRLFNRAGQRVDMQRAQSEADVVAFDAGVLDEGAYIITWRVVSDDGHPVAGMFTFAVGTAEAVDEALLAELAGDTDGVGAAVRITRALTYIATLLAVGVTWFIWWVARAPLDRRRLREVAALSGLAAVAATFAGFVAQAQAVTGRGVGEVLRPAAVAEMLGTPFGQTAALRAIWLVVAVILIARGAPPVTSSLAMAVALGTFAFDGHQRVIEPVLLLAAADLVHLSVAAVWIGGVVGLVLLFRAKRAVPEPDWLAALVGRFSSVALVTMGLLVVSGIAMTLPLVGAPRALTTTDYGVALLVKLALVAWIVTIAAYNRWKLVPEISAVGSSPTEASATADDEQQENAVGADVTTTRVWTRLVTTLKIEAGLVVLVLAATAVLATTPPAATVIGATGLFVDEQPLTDDLTVELVIDPNRVGRNAIHLYVFDAFGQPDAHATNAVIELTHEPTQTGPIRIEPFFAGPGHWVANLDDLALAGTWRIDVAIGIDRFREEQVTFTTTLAE